MLDRDRAVETVAHGLSQEFRPVEQAEAGQLVLPPALAVIADGLLYGGIDRGVLGMEDGNAVLDVLERLIGIYADAQEVRGSNSSPKRRSGMRLNSSS